MGRTDKARGKGAKRLIWAFVILAVLALAIFAALQYSIGRNGPKIVDIVDRVTGGGRDVELVHRQRLGDAPKQKLAVYRQTSDDAAGSALKPVFLFAHGGGWRSGDADDYGFLARGLAPEGYVVVLSGYRLGPDGVFPVMLEDTAKAVAWTRRNIAEHGGDPDAIFISGHSAGAYNVAMLALDPQWLAAEGMDANDLAGVVALSGPYDFLPLDKESTKLAFGGADDLPATQPASFARADAPPMLLIQGEQDTLVRPRNATILANAVTAAGGNATAALYPEMDHNAPILALASPWRRDRALIDRIKAFTNAVSSKPGERVQTAAR